MTSLLSSKYIEIKKQKDEIILTELRGIKLQLNDKYVLKSELIVIFIGAEQISCYVYMSEVLEHFFLLFCNDFFFFINFYLSHLLKKRRKKKYNKRGIYNASNSRTLVLRKKNIYIYIYKSFIVICR